MSELFESLGEALRPKKTKHTPGPWSFSAPTAINNEEIPKHLISIFANDGTHICDKKIISKHLSQHQSNAKLIAAAPELLEALIRINVLTDRLSLNVMTTINNIATEAIKKATR